MAKRKRAVEASAPTSSMIDDHAQESDGEGGTVESELSDVPEDDGSSLKNFVVSDREGEDGDSTMPDVDESESAPLDATLQSQAEDESILTQGDQGSIVDADDSPIIVDRPSRQKRKRRTPQRRSPSASDEENASRLTKGDKMFSDNSGIKASLLPEGLKTRSASKNPLAQMALSSEDDVPEIPRSKVRKLGKAGESSLSIPAANGKTSDMSTTYEAPFETEVASPSALSSIAKKSSRGKKSTNTNAANQSTDISSEIAHAVQTYMTSQTSILAQSVLSHILPAIQEALAPALSTNNAAAKPASDVTALPTTPINRKTSGVAQVPSPDVAAKSVLQPSLMEASPSHPRSSDVNMVMNPDFASLANNSAKASITGETEARSTTKSIDMSSMAFTTSGDSTGESRFSSPVKEPTLSTMDVPPSLEGAQKSSNVAQDTHVAKSSKKILPGLEGAWATTPDPLKLEDGTNDLFQGAIPMYTDGGIFLEDLEQYKAHYNPDHPCQVFDAELQDPLLRDTYIGLLPLPLRHVEATYNPTEGSQSEEKGGHIRFSVWPKCIENCSATTISNAVTFVHSGVFCNPSQTSPRIMSARITKPGSLSYRLNIETMTGPKVAICVSSGMCMSSHIITGVKTFAVTPRQHKYINVVMHNQDWERWAAFMCLCFGHGLLYANIKDLAIQMGTMMSKVENATASRSQEANEIHPELMSPIKSATASPSKSRYDYPVKYALAFEDTVPVYDARNKALDFDDDLADINKLPRWKGEVPVGSFVVVGYTASTYQSPRMRGEAKLEHVSCNLLWIIVCGTPKKR